MDTETIKQTIKIHASVETMRFEEMAAYSDNLLSKLAQQRKEGKFCDAILKVDKREFSVHKCVLAASSVCFETMFSENRLDSNSNGNKVQFHSKYPDILVEVLDYIYTGNIVISSANIAEVVDLAVRLSLMKLQDYCSNYLSKNINEQTCFYIQDLAKQHGLAGLVNVVDGFVFANILKLVESDSLLDINLHSLEVLISRSMPLLEIQRLNIVFRWIEHKINLRKDSLPVLLKFVRWSDVPKNVLFQFFDDTVISMKDDWTLFHVLMSLNNVDLLPDEFKDKFVSLKQTFMDKNNTIPDENENVLSLDEHVDVADNDNNLNTNDDDDDDDATIVDNLNENDLEQDVASSEITVSFEQPRRESSRLALKSKKIQEPTQTDDDSNANLKQEVEGIRNKKRPNRKTADKENSAKGLNAKLDSKKLLNGIKKKKKKERVMSVRLRRATSHLQKAEKVKCSECPFTTNKQEKLVRHVKVAHKDRNRTFSCDICEFECKWNRQFYDHLRTEHFTAGPPYQCDRCGHSAPSVQLLMLHRMDHSEARPHCCNVCSAKFKVKRVLDAHMRCHTGERPFKCTVCSRSFATKGTLDQHKGTHSNQRPYLCDLCGFSTKYQSHLKTHSRIHTGEVFKCQFANCDYQTPKRSQLACHQRSHLRVRCHTCSTCGRSFVERSHLVRHERIHLLERPFKCQQCDYESTRRDKLNEHCKKHHDVTTDDTNKMAYRPRKSRLLSSVNSTANGKTVKQSSTSSNDSKSLQPSCKRRSQVAKNTVSKKKIGHRILSSIPEDVALPASEEAAASSPEPSVVFVKRASNVFQPCKAQCGSKRLKKDCIDPLIAREAEMRKWLSKTTSEPPVSPIEIVTSLHQQQPSVTDISPHFHSFSSRYSSSSGISKGHSGASSSGLGSSRTGETNFMISPSANTAIPCDLSSPGAGSSSSGNLELSPTVGLKIRGSISLQHSAADASKGEIICIPVEKTFAGTSQNSQSQSSHSGEIHSASLSLALQAARKKMIQDKLRRLVNSKSSTTPIKKIFLQKTQPMSVVTFKPDQPLNPGGGQPHS